MVDTILIFNPAASCPNEPARSSRKLEMLTDKVVGFLDNSKPNFEFLVEDLAELLVSRYGVRSVIKRKKRLSARPASDEMIKELSENCDVVITGSGD